MDDWEMEKAKLDYAVSPRRPECLVLPIPGPRRTNRPGLLVCRCTFARRWTWSVSWRPSASGSAFRRWSGSASRWRGSSGAGRPSCGSRRQSEYPQPHPHPLYTCSLPLPLYLFRRGRLTSEDAEEDWGFDQGEIRSLLAPRSWLAACSAEPAFGCFPSCRRERSGGRWVSRARGQEEGPRRRIRKPASAQTAAVRQPPAQARLGRTAG